MRSNESLRLVILQLILKQIVKGIEVKCMSGALSTPILWSDKSTVVDSFMLVDELCAWV